MGWEPCRRELHCANCRKAGVFTYQEADGPYMGATMIDEHVSGDFIITKNTGIAISTEIACAKCGQVVKRGMNLGSAPLPTSSKSRSRTKRRT